MGVEVSEEAGHQVGLVEEVVGSAQEEEVRVAAVMWVAAVEVGMGRGNPGNK